MIQPDNLTVPLSRRELLTRSGMGFGALALQHLLAGSAVAEQASPSGVNPLLPTEAPPNALISNSTLQ